MLPVVVQKTFSSNQFAGANITALFVCFANFLILSRECSLAVNGVVIITTSTIILFKSRAGGKEKHKATKKNINKFHNRSLFCTKIKMHT